MWSHRPRTYAFLRSYDTGYPDLEVGAEATPKAYLEALWAATAEMMRVLKPTGSIFIDLGDKYNSAASGQNGTGRSSLQGHGGEGTSRDTALAGRGATVPGVREKSLMLLPERYRVGCVDTTRNGYLHAEAVHRVLDDLAADEIDYAEAHRQIDQLEAAAAKGSPGLGLIARSVIVWSKPNGLPESVVDRVRRSHEDWVHLVKQPRYYSATDEIREPYALASLARYNQPYGVTSYDVATQHDPRPGKVDANPLGKLPGSVWSIPSEPLSLPGYFITRDGTLQDFLAPNRGRPRPRTNNGNGHGLFDLDPYAELAGGEDAGAWRWLRATGINASPWPRQDVGLQLRTAASHYAAFPSRWPEQLIKAFSPPGICVECGTGRFPVVEREGPLLREGGRERKGKVPYHGNGHGMQERWDVEVSTLGGSRTATILGYACSCTPFTDHPGTEGTRVKGTHPSNIQANPGGGVANYERHGPWREYHLDRWIPPPTRPAVVLDPFSGTGTTPMVARALGRIGIGIDLSAAYCRAARWRIRHQAGKAISRTNLERQGSLLP